MKRGGRLVKRMREGEKGKGKREGEGGRYIIRREHDARQGRVLWGWRGKGKGKGRRARSAKQASANPRSLLLFYYFIIFRDDAI